jgi:hypothetical protein
MMPFYLYEGTYSGEGWVRLIADPKDMTEVMRPGVEHFGGRIVACMMSISAEPIGFVEFPDDTSAAAWCMSLLVQQGVKTVRMVQLITSQAGVEAMRKAGSTGTGAPGW